MALSADETTLRDGYRIVECSVGLLYVVDASHNRVTAGTRSESRAVAALRAMRDMHTKPSEPSLPGKEAAHGIA